MGIPIDCIVFVTYGIPYGHVVHTLFFRSLDFHARFLHFRLSKITQSWKQFEINQSPNTSGSRSNYPSTGIVIYLLVCTCSTICFPLQFHFNSLPNPRKYYLFYHECSLANESLLSSLLIEKCLVDARYTLNASILMCLGGMYRFSFETYFPFQITIVEMTTTTARKHFEKNVAETIRPPSNQWFVLTMAGIVMGRKGRN